MTPRAQERTASGVERDRERPSPEFCPLCFLFQARSLGSGLWAPGSVRGSAICSLRLKPPDRVESMQ